MALSWNNPEDDSITGYLILRGPDADNLATIVESTGNAEVSYTDETASSDTTYVYAIKAINDAGESAQSATTEVTTPKAPGADDISDDSANARYVAIDEAVASRLGDHADQQSQDVD